MKPYRIATPFLIVLSALLMLAGGCRNGSGDAERHAAAFAGIQADFNARLLQVKDRSAYAELLNSRNKRLRELLDRLPETKESEDARVLRARILVNLNRPGEAEALLKPLLRQGHISPRAAMVQVLIHMARRQTRDAQKLFRSIENDVPDASDRHNAWLYFAMLSKDPAVRRQYALKFVNSTDMPPHFALFRANVYQQLAQLDILERRFVTARAWLDKALGLTRDPAMRASLQGEKQRLELLGEPPPGLEADHWLNGSGSTFSLDRLKGKVVLIDFWAPWCNPCRMVIPDLIQMYNDWRERGLVIIGMTRLHGFYRDDRENHGRVDAAEEFRLIREFVQRKGINYPVAVSREGDSFQAYRISGIPTMVLIDRRGRIAAINVGAGHPESLRSTIESLLKEKI